MTQVYEYRIGDRVRVLDCEDAREWGRVSDVGVIEKAGETVFSQRRVYYVRFETPDKGLNGSDPDDFVDPFYRNEIRPESRPTELEQLRAENARLLERELAIVASAKSLLFAMPDFIIDSLRDCAGNTNAELVRNWRDKLKEAIDNPHEYAAAMIAEYAEHAKTSRQLRAENEALREQLARMRAAGVNAGFRDGD